MKGLWKVEVVRSQEEIVARIDQVLEEDLSGIIGTFVWEALSDRLDFEHAQKYLKEGVTEAEWLDALSEVEPLEEAAKLYLELAVEKIENERGLSAERSVIKLTEFAWLAGRDDIVDAMERAPYPMYGEPKVRVFADMLGWEYARG